MMPGARARKYLIIECQQTVSGSIPSSTFTIQLPPVIAPSSAAPLHPDQKTGSRLRRFRSNAGNNGARCCAADTVPQCRLRCGTKLKHRLFGHNIFASAY
ncbi:hypothetical protein KCP71_02910 [Salmonella enterica subsp. enterica]|nr:hypothetical protein KCP71_02910 [Salmonella enterica subsp. enterica]